MIKVGSVGLTNFTGKFIPKKAVPSIADNVLLAAKRVSSGVADEPWKPVELPLKRTSFFPEPVTPKSNPDEPKRGVEEITPGQIVEWF